MNERSVDPQAYQAVAHALDGTIDGDMIDVPLGDRADQVVCDVYLDEIDGQQCLWLEELAVSVEGRGTATRIMQALKDHADERRLPLYVGPVVNNGFWQQPRFAWLADAGWDIHGDPVLVYRPRT